MSRTDELVEAMREFHRGRQRSGLRRKFARLAEGAFEFFRGTDFLFARDWPALRPADTGPAALICGDLHLENFGAAFAANGAVRFDINDFDEAIIGPCAFDVVRCATSTLLAAEAWGMKPTQGTGMVLDYLDAYRDAVIADQRNPPERPAQPDLGAVSEMLEGLEIGSPRRSIERDARRTGRDRWRLRRGGSSLVPVKPRRREQLRASIEEFGRPHGWKLLDVLRRFAGIGSLGLRRYQLLIEAGDGALQLLSLKEAAPSSVRDLALADLPPLGSEAERVVWAERQLRGEPRGPLAALVSDGRSYRLRAVIHEENRADLNRLRHDPAKLRDAAAVAGRLTARAHRHGCAAAGTDSAALHDWVSRPAFEAMLAATVRLADRVVADFRSFKSAYRAGAFPLDTQR